MGRQGGSAPTSHPICFVGRNSAGQEVISTFLLLYVECSVHVQQQKLGKISQTGFALCFNSCSLRLLQD